VAQFWALASTVRYKSIDWSLEVPDGWSHQQDEDCTTFCHPQGVSAFQVSSYRKDEVVTDDDLREFAGEIPLAAVSLGQLTGFRTRFSEDDTFWTKWWLRIGRQMIHVTYNCPLSQSGHEDVEVGAMIQSLTSEHE
jgi:hypothetical protein